MLHVLIKAFDGSDGLNVLVTEAINEDEANNRGDRVKYVMCIVTSTQ